MTIVTIGTRPTRGGIMLKFVMTTICIISGCTSEEDYKEQNTISTKQFTFLPDD